MKKVISLALVAIFCLALAACGAPGHDFTCADVVDASAGQQRWLKSFDSNMVINPDAIGAEEYTDGNGKVGIDIGVTDEDGNVVKVFNDVVFFIETNYANGKGGEAIWSAVFEGGDVNSSFVIKDDGVNNSDGTTCIITCGPENGASVAPKRHKQPLDGVTEYYLVVGVSSLTGGEPQKDGTIEAPTLGVNGTLTNPISKLDIADIADPGTYVYRMNEYAFDGTEAGGPRVFIPRLDFGKYCGYTVTDFAIKTFLPGFTYADKEMSNIWYPYQIVSSQTFNNDSSIKVEDMITAENSVTRVVTAESCGSVCLAGVIDGSSVTYDSKAGTIQIKGDGYEYTVCCKRSETITFYDTEEDMLGDMNGSAEYKSTSKYWVLSPVVLTVGNTFNVGISASLSGADTVKGAKDATLNSTVKKAMNNGEAKWDEFIASNDVSDYIENIPEGK